jgi:hypothetical protein
LIPYEWKLPDGSVFPVALHSPAETRQATYAQDLAVIDG